MKGEETSHYLIDRCLMRPRSLIEFLQFCRSHAVNLGHTRIEVEDIEQGEENYSTQLVNDISYEIMDVYPGASEVMYEFIECPAEINDDYLNKILTNITDDLKRKNDILDLLLWYGILGFRKSDGNPVFIYNVHYDMKYFKALIRKRKEDGIVYVINPAFWKGLGIIHDKV